MPPPTTGLQVFDATLQKTHSWFKDLMDELGWEDRQAAYVALRGVLHILRDRLTVEEAAQLGAQLPMLIRGFYYEGWTPKDKPVKLGRDEFIEAAKNTIPDTVPDSDKEVIVRAVFATLSKKISDGEIEDIKDLMPKDLKDLWPN